jgi:bifunctional DNA-binding transcriptional regulator/antitoxin component of YhaV-PrlF toxin-antitoxin module
MRMTSKVTIPQELRERFALGPGAEVEVVATEVRALVRPAGRSSEGSRPAARSSEGSRLVARSSEGSRLVARLRDRADGGLTADEVLRLTRGVE